MSSCPARSAAVVPVLSGLVIACLVAVALVIGHGKGSAEDAGLRPGVAVASAHTCALTQEGAVKCTGGNPSGQLGNGSFTSSAVPVQVTGLESGVRDIFAGSHNSCAIKDLGELVCWGNNNWGQLGNSTTTNSNVPVHIADNVATVAIGPGFICYTQEGGDTRCAGVNDVGQLGIGTAVGPANCGGAPCSKQFLPSRAVRTARSAPSTVARALF